MQLQKSKVYGRKLRFLQEVNCAKFTVDAAAELCGIVLSLAMDKPKLQMEIERLKWRTRYMTAGMTKFLRIYYGKVRDCLKEKGLWEQPAMEESNRG